MQNIASFNSFELNGNCFLKKLFIGEFCFRPFGPSRMRIAPLIVSFIQTLTAELREVSGRLQSEKQTSGDYLRQLNLAKQSVEESRSELTDYKNKAVKILQVHRITINNLRQSEKKFSKLFRPKIVNTQRMLISSG